MHTAVFAGLYSELGRGMSVLTVDYRVAPEHPYPAALEDAITGYNWLLQAGWQEHEIVVAGDSAGGGLALALCMYLKNQNRKLPAEHLDEEDKEIESKFGEVEYE